MELGAFVKVWSPGLFPHQLAGCASREAAFPAAVDPSPSASFQTYSIPSSSLEDSSEGVSLLLETPLALQAAGNSPCSAGRAG